MSSGEKPTLLLIDGHSLAFRAFYALSPDNFKNSAGQHTNAVHGFISMMLNILELEKPTHLCVAFDVSRESFRTKELPEYKGTRGETPEEFIGQTELLVEALTAMNIVSVSRENYEADDLIASLSVAGEKAGMEVLVVSGDRDTFQLITEKVTILYPVKGVLNLARMDDAAVLEKYGVHARQYPELAALVGETSDNLKGIPGVGPKTAAKWIQEFGSLEAILQNAEQIPGKVGNSLRENAELAVRNRRLNHLLRDLEFDFTLEDLELGPVNEDAVSESFAKLSFRTLLTRVLKLRGTNGSQHKVISAKVMHEESDHTSVIDAPAAATSAVIADLPTEPIPSELADLVSIERLIGSGDCCVHVEIADSKVVGLGAATLSKRLQWNGEGNPDPLLETGGFGTWDYKMLSRNLAGIGISLGPITNDPLLSCYLIDPLSKDLNPDAQIRQHAGIDIVRQDPNELLSQSDPSLDAWIYSVLVAVTCPQLEAEGSLAVYRDIELPASAVLAKMEQLGIAVDRDYLETQFQELDAEVAKVAQEAYAIIGHEVNLASPKQLQTVLFEELGMVGTRSVKTGFSTNAEALATLYEQTEHPFLERLLAHRDATKLRQMAETLIKSIEKDGRIHTSYSQVGTSTGRLSSENPNLQNIPIRSARGQKLRGAFIAGAGFETLLTADYSQIELRIMAHMSQDAGLIEAFNAGEDLHNFVGSRLYDVAPDQVTPDMRAKVKAMSYGLAYGLSDFGLARQLRIDKREAKQLMEDYFSRFGGIKTYLDQVVQRAKTLGYTTTIYGRRRPFPDLNSKIFQLRENARRAALNAPMQGTAADIMKIAMVNVAKAMDQAGLRSQLLLQVHDELVFAVYPGELETLKQLAVTQLGQVVKLSVPLDVHIGVGANWELAGH
ncbi:DNA polymerase I [Aquiluna borgnonia]|uniref:DNA polymerase I n=1 Tax=Aquiluna borgnonia TaxID=2499157 RepID=A0A7D4Q4R5_9MICO|nr:DNA polymerase I [Aquiluna borgnonia]QKJ25303.1 DNA polymerase I [Aquiluna borgnonia]